MRSTSDYKNVKNFGAKGDGSTDDWAAIMAAVNWTASQNRGTVFFPPGTYLVSQPITWGPISIASDFNLNFTGVFGASIVTGNFADYVFKRALADTAGNSGCHTVENLTIINTHATGGGIRIGYCVGAAVRNCAITANKGINTASDDVVAGVTSLEVAVENCTLNPGSNPSGSLGISSVSDGPTINCTVTGFDLGVHFYGQQGGQVLIGCRIELCVVGISGNCRVSGCLFKNCGTAIGDGGGFYHGVRIEGAEGTIAGNPQYGMKLTADGIYRGQYWGIVVTGQFAKYGIEVIGGEAFAARAMFIGVQVTNTSTLGGLPWHIPATAGTAQFIGCNVAPVFTMANLPAFPQAVTTIVWTATAIGTFGAITGGTGGADLTYGGVALTGGSGTGATAEIQVSGGSVISVKRVKRGSGYAVSDVLSALSANIGGVTGFSIPVATISPATTVTFTGGNLSPLSGAALTITVGGVTPSGFNGVFNGVTVTLFNEITYSQTNPGASSGSGGTVVINAANGNGSNASEGDTYNVSDAGTSTWGSNPVGGGSTHGKVRWNGSNWAAMGK